MSDQDQSKKTLTDKETNVEIIQDATTNISFVHQNVKIEAIITIKPHISLGKEVLIQSKNINFETIKKNPRFTNTKSIPIMHNFKQKQSSQRTEDPLSFVVTQDLLLKIPLLFSADASITSKQVILSDSDLNSSLEETPEKK